MRWHTWLIVHEPPNHALRAILDEAGLLARVDATARPRARLGLSAGRVWLWSDDADRLFERVRSKGRVLAFTAADTEHCAALDGVRIQHAGRQFRIHRVSANSSPYAARLLELRFETVAALPDLTGDVVCAAQDHEIDLPPLHVDPMEFELPERVLAGVLGDPLRWQPCNGLFLPPLRVLNQETRDSRRGSGVGDYFDGERLELRTACAATLGFLQCESQDPAAVRMVRAADHPVLRDILTDGGRLELVGENGEPTRVRIAFTSAGESALVAYRALLWTCPPACSAVRSTGTEALLAALRRDLCDLFDGWAEVGDTTEVTRWRVPRLRPFCSEPRVDEGNWPRLQPLAQQLPRELRECCWQWVLAPAEARDGWWADSDLAERLFLAHLWRCPWSENTGGGPWRTAFCELLHHDWTGVRVSPAERVARWGKTTGWPRLGASGPQSKPVVEHRPMETPDVLTTMRLLLPLGGILRRTGMAVFDDATARFDRGLWA